MIYSVFISYSTVDTSYKDEFLKHLKVLEVEKLIKIWDADLVKIGTDWDSEIKEQVNESDILIVLLSPDSVISEYIIDVEIKLALKKKKRIFPILLKSCNWFNLSISRYQCLPKNGQPISSFEDKDGIYASIVAEIRDAVKKDDIGLSKSGNTHPKVDYKLLHSNLNYLGMLIREAVSLMDRIPLKEETNGETVVTFLDVSNYDKEIFSLSLDFVTLRNSFLDELEKIDEGKREDIEKDLEEIFSYVTLNRFGQNISEKEWKQAFRREILEKFKNLFNKSVNI